MEYGHPDRGATVKQALARAMSEGSRLLPEDEAKSLLSLFGIVAPNGRRVLDLAGAAAAAEDLPGLGRCHATTQLFHAGLGASHLDATTGGLHSHRLVLSLAVPCEMGHLLVVVDREDEVGRVACGAARIGKRPLVHLDYVLPTELGQVMDH